MADLVQKLRDLDSPASRVAQSVAAGAFTTFVSPRRLTSRGLTVLHASSGLFGAAAAAYMLGSKASPQQRAVAGAATGVAFYGASVVGFAADAAAEGWLRRRGVRHPRVWMGLVAAVGTWATSKPSRDADAGAEDEDQPEAASDAAAAQADTHPEAAAGPAGD